MFYRAGSARCWRAILSHHEAEVKRDPSGGKLWVRPTPISASGVTAFADIFSASHPCQQLLEAIPAEPIFVSAATFHRAVASHQKPRSLLDIVLDCWLKFKARRPASLRFYVAMWERTHWIVDSSVMLGLHPSQNPGVDIHDLDNALALWFDYSRERKRRADAIRPVLKDWYSTLFEAASSSNSAGPAPQLDAELFFEPTVPLPPMAS